MFPQAVCYSIPSNNVYIQKWNSMYSASDLVFQNWTKISYKINCDVFLDASWNGKAGEEKFTHIFKYHFHYFLKQVSKKWCSVSPSVFTPKYVIIASIFIIFLDAHTSNKSIEHVCLCWYIKCTHSETRIIC